MADKQGYQVVHPPNLLKAKRGGEPIYGATAVAHAEAALEAARAEPREAGVRLEAMRRRAHDVKGQAGTFG